MINVLGLIFSVLLGAAVGSFLNVVIYRYNTGLKLTGRSMCLSCRAPLSPRDLIPILSYALSRGRCRYCGSHVSAQYPVVEGLTALIFGLIFLRFGVFSAAIMPFSIVYYFMVGALLLAIGGYDFRHQIIPNGLVYAFGALALLSPIITGFDSWLLAAVVVRLVHNAVSGVIFYFLFWSLWSYSSGKWIGLGDAKLAAGIGFLFGFAEGLTAILTGFWAGAIVGLGLIGLSKWSRRQLPAFLSGFKINLQTEIAFAPFLIFGVLFVIITGLNVLPL